MDKNNMGHEKEYKICNRIMKCKCYHPEIGCICENDNKPYPPECYRNQTMTKEVFQILLETGSSYWLMVVKGHFLRGNFTPEDFTFELREAYDMVEAEVHKRAMNGMAEYNKTMGGE